MKNKVALITGGTSGIGRAAAVAFARRGAKVVVTGRRPEEGNETIRLIEKEGGTGFFFKSDVSKEDDCRAMVEEAVKRFSRLDYAFNNAGIEGNIAPLVENTLENLNQVMAVNVGGIMLSMKYEVQAMLKSGGGSIVNTASVAGVIGMPGMSAYVASKHAVLGYTKCVALELARENIRVNAVSPAAIQTEMYDRFTGGREDFIQHMKNLHPVGRVGTSEEVASAVVYLCSDEAAFITGTSVAIDGGFTAQ